jgi:hippurate hydrolase
LSGFEKRTSGVLAARLKAAGLKVLTRIGGYGVAGILRNGPGPTILVRADMDALPVTEETGLAYASRVRGAMHACGHDLHTANLAAVAGALKDARDLWRGTIVFVGQPSEETASGAQAMIDDGLWRKVPVPDACIALHVEAEIPVGRLGIPSGWFTANTDSVDVTIFGKGGHGARPHEAEDPIVAAAQVIIALQTIVTRRIDPLQTVVITVGSIHAGRKHNIIPDRADLQLTVRTFSSDTRRLVLRAIREVVRDAARAAGCTRMPEVKTDVEYTAAVYNEPALAEHATEVFSKRFGRSNVIAMPPTTGGEDFSAYLDSIKAPGLMYGVGATKGSLLKGRAKSAPCPIPLHNSRFAPVIPETLRNSFLSMCSLVGSVMGRK